MCCNMPSAFSWCRLGSIQLLWETSNSALQRILLHLPDMNVKVVDGDFVLGFVLSQLGNYRYGPFQLCRQLILFSSQSGDLGYEVCDSIFRDISLLLLPDTIFKISNGALIILGFSTLGDCQPTN